MKKLGWIVAAGVVLWWCAGRHEAADRRPVEAPHVAVMAPGFATIDGPGGNRRVVELGETGAVEWHATTRLPAESRVVGSGLGLAAVWRDGTKVVVAALDDEGEPGKRYEFGTKVRVLCDGVASNDTRWAVGWIEGDGNVWIVHGDAGRRDADAAAIAAVGPADAIAARTTWCGVASAGDNVMLLWRRGDRMFMNACSKRDCSGSAPQIPAEVARQTVLAVGCLRDGCGFVARDDAGATKIAWVSDTGKLRWTTPIGDARRDSVAEVIGAGDRQLAVAYASTEHGAVVIRVDKKGAVAPVWRAADASTAVPGLAWSRGRLLLARVRGADLVTDVVAMPR